MGGVNSPEVLILKARLVELAAEYKAIKAAKFIAATAEKAISDFKIAQKLVMPFAAKITAAAKGQAADFTAEEQDTLKTVATAATKIISQSQNFTAEELANNANILANAKGLQKVTESMVNFEAQKMVAISYKPDLLRDESGNLIVVPDGSPIQIENKLVKKYIYNGVACPIKIKCTTQFVHIFTNQHQPIKGWIIHSIDDAFLVIADNKVVRFPPNKFEELKKEIHVESNCHGETLANGQVFIPDFSIKTLFQNDKEFKSDSSLTNIVVFFDEKNEPKHSAKYKKNTKKYRYDNGEQKPIEGNLKDAQGQYKNPKGFVEVEKRVKQNKGIIKDGIRIIEKDSDVKK